MKDTAIEILLVEDNLGDVRLTEEALAEAGIRHRLNAVHDGADAIDFLLQRGRHAHAPRPDLILLDLNLPRKGGREVIAAIKAEPSLRTTPLVVFTSSSHEQHVLDGYDPRKCLYTVKPPTFEDSVDTMQQIHQFWLETTSQDSQP